MKNIEKTKLVFGYILIIFSLIGVVVAVFYQFDFHLFELGFYSFGQGHEGGASNIPIFYGLSAIAGALLLASVKKEDKKEKSNSQ